MKEIISIYSKLLISILSFIAPAITLLLNVFIDGVEKFKARNEEEIKQIEKITKMNVQNDSEDFEKTIKDSLKSLTKNKSRAKKQLKLLNPKRQILRLFIPLILALILVICYIYIKEYVKSINFPFVRISCLILSGVFFTYGLFVLYQLFCIIIETKRKLNFDTKQDVLNPAITETPNT
ncbi:MAG: hypothetical protein CVU05_02540 [Bacteroidetes bacterium HGW-Bacteroidetes-21]|jgi:Flp pilus assembly protein TadB|nr:MAG: hypothetical protein CVU05_02540 [Bacteroidetes bacterium HGW-Bacteroidetes-21]